jgi:hypothetical protein
MRNSNIFKLIYNKNNFIKIIIICILSYVIYFLYSRTNKIDKINEGFLITTPIIMCIANGNIYYTNENITTMTPGPNWTLSDTGGLTNVSYSNGQAFVIISAGNIYYCPDYTTTVGLREVGRNVNGANIAIRQFSFDGYNMIIMCITDTGNLYYANQNITTITPGPNWTLSGSGGLTNVSYSNGQAFVINSAGNIYYFPDYTSSVGSREVGRSVNGANIAITKISFDGYNMRIMCIANGNLYYANQNITTTPNWTLSGSGGLTNVSYSNGKAFVINSAGNIYYFPDYTSSVGSREVGRNVNGANIAITQISFEEYVPPTTTTQYQPTTTQYQPTTTQYQPTTTRPTTTQPNTTIPTGLLSSPLAVKSILINNKLATDLILGNGNNGGRPLQISQLAVYAMVNGVETNVALTTNGGVASAFSTFPGLNPSHAIDGTLSPKVFSGNAYHSGGGGNNEWWYLELNNIYNVHRIVYYNRGDCCKIRAKGSEIQLFSTSQNDKVNTSTPIYTYTFDDTLIQEIIIYSIPTTTQYQPTTTRALSTTTTGARGAEALVPTTTGALATTNTGPSTTKSPTTTGARGAEALAPTSTGALVPTTTGALLPTTTNSMSTTIPLITYGFKVKDKSKSSPETEIYQHNFEGTSNIYSPSIYYNTESFDPLNVYDDSYAPY